MLKNGMPPRVAGNRLSSFSLGYLSKITQNTQKKHSVCPTIVKKSPIGLKCCRTCLWVQGELKIGLAEVIFH